MPTDVIESQPQTLSEDIVQKLSRHNAINLIIQESESDGSDKKGKENSQEEYLFSANELIMRKRKPRASDKKKLEVFQKPVVSPIREVLNIKDVVAKTQNEEQQFTPVEDVSANVTSSCSQHDTKIDPWICDLLSTLNIQTDTLQETAHQLAANAHAGLIFKAAAEQLETMRNTARAILRDVARWEDACVQCEHPPLSSDLSTAANEIEKHIEAFPNAGNIKLNDPRLTRYLKPVFAIYEEATTLSELISYLVHRSRDPKSPEDATSDLRALHAQIKVLSALTLEEELEQLLQIVLSENVSKRIIEIASERFGVRGYKKTLQELAADFNVSRERIRQIIKPYENSFQELIGNRPFTPVFDRVIEFIVSWAPGSVDELLEELVSQDLITSSWNLKALRYWIQQLGDRDQFSFVDVHQYHKGNIVYIECSQHNDAINMGEGYLNQIIHMARRQVARWGVASIEDIVSKLQSDESLNVLHPSIDSQTIQRLLSTQFDFSWLDKDYNWFWFSKSERGGKYWNGLLTQVKKIFAVTNEIQISELRKGVARDVRREGFAPPRAVLLELCRQLSWLKVENDTISLTNKSEVEAALSATESILYRTLQRNDFIMSRKDLEKNCFAAGMSEPTLDVRLGASPIIVRYATSVYGLRGHPVEPGKVDEVIAQTRYENKGRSRVLQDYGWKDSDIWISYKVSKGILNGVCSLPAGLKTFLNGGYELQTFDGVPMGTLVFGDNQCWGIGSFMRRRGGEIGDYFLMRMNLSTRIAQIKLGDESIIDDYR
jgi:hypothetical protein